MVNDDLHARIDSIEQESEQLAAVVESCRKAMLISKVLMTASAVTLCSGLIGLMQLQAAAAVLCFGAFIGGVVWYGSNHSTRVEAVERMKANDIERSRAIDALEFRGGVTLH